MNKAEAMVDEAALAAENERWEEHDATHFRWASFVAPATMDRPLPPDVARSKAVVDFLRENGAPDEVLRHGVEMAHRFCHVEWAAGMLKREVDWLTRSQVQTLQDRRRQTAEFNARHSS